MWGARGYCSCSWGGGGAWGGGEQAMGDLLTKFLDNKAFAVLVKNIFYKLVRTPAKYANINFILYL